MTAQPTLAFPDKMKGYECPCCGQFVKMYSRAFNSNMGVALLVLYRNRERGYVHLENLLTTSGYRRCGDASYLKHYGFIEPLNEERKDGSKRNGKYRITGRGIMFCELKLTASSKFLMFNNKCYGFEGEEVNIKGVLGTKFNYAELMQESTIK